MAKFLYKHRRGTTSDWANKGDEIIPLEGEIVIELDTENKLHKLKIGDGVTPYSQLKYLQAGDEIVTQVLAQAKPRVVTVELTAEWTTDGDDKYSQTLTVDGITSHSRLDLQPSADMLTEFKQLGLVFVTENNAGTMTVYSIGNMPAKSYTMQATIVETECNGANMRVVGDTVGAPVAQADWEQIAVNSPEFIKNKPTLGTLAAKDKVEKTDLADDVQAALDKAGSSLDSYTETDPTVPAWAKASTKPTYTKFEVGLDNVENVKQYSASNPPPYPVTTVNSKTGAVTLSAGDVGALPDTTKIPTKTSDLTNDSGYITDSDIAAHNTNTSAHTDIREQISQLSSEIVDCVKSVNNIQPDENGNVTVQVQAEQIPIVDSIDEMTDTSKRYVLKSTGTIHQYKESTYEKTVTVTDTIEATTENPYIDNSRLGSSTATDSYNTDVPGYHLTPIIDFTSYAGKTIQLHLDGCQYSSTGSYALYIQSRFYKSDKSVAFARAYTADVTSDGGYLMENMDGVTVTHNSETSTTITLATPIYCRSASIETPYARFCGKGAVADSRIYITYEETQTVTEKTWVDTGVSFGGSGIDEETLAEIAKISVLNNEGADPSIIKLLPKPILDFYSTSDYPSDDYTTSHLSKITYPCRADIPVPFNVKWEHNENAMRTTVAVDTKAIGTNNAYTLKTYDATGSDNYPLYNLLPNTRYYYKVTHVMADGSLVEAKSGNFFTSSEPWRLLYIEGTQNVRDLGGWTGLNGKKVKYGKIIRGAALSDSSGIHFNVTGKGRQAFGDLRIKAELNLGAIDNETSIAANCAYKKIGYTNYAIAITGETYRAQFKEALEYIVSCLDGTLTQTGLYQEERNIYMHCQGGCDRAGTLAFQLLGLLGVSESDLAKEYELSSFSDVGFGRLRTTTKAVDVYDYVGMVEAIKAYSGDTITDKFYNFAVDCGVSEDTITSFRSLMLE